MKALYIASTGMSAQERNVEVISNNIANMRTTGFKRMRAEFQDLLYQSYRRAGSQHLGPGHHGAGRHRDRLGRQDRGDPARHEPGLDRRRPRRTSTSRSAAKASSSVQLPDGRTAYTRDGSFERDSSGQLVNVDGYQVQPGITIPDGANSISISADGMVEVFLGNESTPTQLGQIQLARFVNKAGLESLGDNLFVETGASAAPPRSACPTPTAWATCMQGYLEMANVNAVTEIADLIAAQRAYEMNARVISGADEMMSATSQLR